MTGRTFDRRLLVLALLPLAIYALVYIVIDRARPTGLEFAIIDPAEFAKVAAAEGQLRYYWLSAFVLLAAVSLAVAASAAMSLYRDAPRRDRGIIFGLVSLAAVAVIGSEVMGVAARWYTYLGEGLFETIFSQITVGADGDLTLLQAFKIGQEVIKGSAAVALLLLTAGLIVTLTRPPTDASFKARAQHIAAAALRQRTYLQHAALVYVFAMLSMLAWMYWPSPFLASDAVRNDYKDLVMGAAILQGTAFSLGVAAIYLPPALLLRHRSTMLTSSIGPDTELDPETEAAFEPLSVHPFDQFRQVAVMMMPVMVSLLPAVKDLWGVAV